MSTINRIFLLGTFIDKEELSKKFVVKNTAASIRWALTAFL